MVKIAALSALIDPYGRVINSLRVLITSRCNYKCIYCHREGVFTSTDEVFSSEDYGFIAKVARKLGVKYYKISGGEPLVREDVHYVVKYIKEHAEEVSLVTNGSLLAAKAKELAEAGLDRVNVSLHSLRPEVYKYVTGGSMLLRQVLNGIDCALNYGIRVKINYLVLKSNIEEFKAILEFAELKGVDINVIELIPLGVPKEVYTKEHASISSIIKYLEGVAIRKYYRELHNRPVYVLGSGIKVEVVVGYGNSLFCSKCSRLRLTPDGYLKPCLYIESPRVSIVRPVKERDEESLVRAFKEITSLRKPYFTWQG
jgi:cyclic pyranopterin phosphate synthase